MSEESFSAEWLTIREPVDHRSRAAGLIPLLKRWWDEREGTHHVVDLGSGTGSNLRYLAPRLSGEQQWTVVDHDQELLDRVASVPGVMNMTWVVGDLAKEGLAAVQDADLVTGSALLDLVSERWLERLVAASVNARCAALFSLSYDGLISWSDEDPDDAFVVAAVNEHQRRDKGLGGSALGPTAGDAAEAAFRAAGFRTWAIESPWRLDGQDSFLATALVEGLAQSAAEQRPDESERVLEWGERRRETIAGGEFVLVVGHLDVLALPAE